MKKTDYARVSKTYDLNPDRLEIPRDPWIGRLVDQGPVQILDLACGTGNYLRCQAASYAGAPVGWWGLDLSPEMLALARAKVPQATLVEGSAEALPFPDGHFHLVVCHFAFHHFAQKQRVLDEVRRVLVPGGRFHQKNVVPEFMKQWWVYRTCPETAAEDLHRFWPKDLMVYELHQRGFRTTVEVTYREDQRSLERLKTDYLRRDTSQLANIDDQAYRRGLARIDSEIQSGATEYRYIFALLEIWAEKAQD